MKSTIKRIGDFISVVDERNNNTEIKRLLGINIFKKFIPTVANQTGLDLSNYKVIRKGRFACNIMHVGRDEKLPISLYPDQEPAIVSPAYITFEVNDSNEILSEYLMTIFQRQEFDRFVWFVSDSSVRGGLDWDRFCDIQIPIPVDFVDQKRFVVIYNSLVKNQQCYNKSIPDLQIICNSFLDSLIKTEELKLLGDYIIQSEEINTNNEITNLLGISVEKKFFPSKIKQDGINLKTYKIIRRRQFGYVSVTSRNGEKISIALLEESDGIVSSTYIVFDVIDKTTLMPEYLYLWFKRPEFDRYARFYSWGSARETFDWDQMCKVKLPIPDIKIQESIVAVHHALESRKRINERLNNMVTSICPVLIKGVVDSLDKNDN